MTAGNLANYAANPNANHVSRNMYLAYIAEIDTMPKSIEQVAIVLSWTAGPQLCMLEGID